MKYNTDVKIIDLTSLRIVHKYTFFLCIILTLGMNITITCLYLNLTTLIGKYMYRILDKIKKKKNKLKLIGSVVQT